MVGKLQQIVAAARSPVDPDTDSKSISSFLGRF
jgi:hypothetical protein